MKELESKFLENVKIEFGKLTDKDSINKLYRQARIFVRCYWLYCEGCDKQHSWELNESIKLYRWRRLEELGYATVLRRREDGTK